MSRFGASKFRNAVPHIPGREEWYRGSLPNATSSTASSSATSTFSSEVKCNRQWIVTVTAVGDISWRRYQGTEVGTAKLGNVGDWDLSRLEDSTIVVGGTDGTIIVYRIVESEASQLETVQTIKGSSPITTVGLHPTTPNLLLVSSISSPAVIYDTSATTSEPVIRLNAKEPKGLWTSAWSNDGRSVVAVGRSGTGYIWNPRSSSDPIVTKTLSLQPLKPARVICVGSDIFLTAFDRSRNRFFALLSSRDLSTTFSQNIDTNTAPLLSQVDQERRIVYLSGRGDMTLRQIELSGPMGYQETLHSLPSPIAGTALALASPTILPVMQAQIATLLLPIVDKDGDALLPFGIRVPRRQLIDYHDDLYPEVVGTVAEQNASDWLDGKDATPLNISLDPSRRSTWEERLEKAKSPPSPRHQAEASTEANIGTSPAASAPEAPHNPIVAVRDASSSQPATPKTTEKPKSQITLHPSLPPLENDETHSSTSYKVRIIAEHIAEQYKSHKSSGENEPLFVGLQGPQGCGKTTLCDTLVARLRDKYGLTTAVLSLDDLYLPHKGLKDLASRHPENKLLAGRGPPGTHDTKLATSVLDAVKLLRDGSRTVELPIFDKSLCGGEGDRSTDTIRISGPLDVFFLEGWSMGFSPLSEEEVKTIYENKNIPFTSSKTKYFTSHSLDSLIQLNSYLSEFSTIYQPFKCLIEVEPDDYEHVFKWRLQQEHAMKAKNGGKGMTDDQVRAFVERYMPGYELWREGIWGDRPWNGKGLRLFYGSEREVVKVEKPFAVTPKAIQVSQPKSSSTPTVRPPTVEEEPVTSTSSASSKGTRQAHLANTSTQPSASSSLTSGPIKGTSQPQSRFNPGWSRKFLAAKSPLIPTYDSVPPLSSLHQDSLVFKVTRHLAFFPVQGPGGRLGVHPLKKKGRMATGGEGYLSNGVEIAAFDAEIVGARVVIAGEDGVIRFWSVSEDGVQGVGPEPDRVLKGSGIDKVAQVTFHPTARDLLVGLTNDQGKASLRFWDLAKGDEIRQVSLDFPGIFNFTWTSDGSRVALATKDGQIVVLDPRTPEKQVCGKAHDSPRSFQLVWLDETHLISVGFSRGSQRRINLYKVTDMVTTVSSLLIDVSPSVLFPHYDSDTSILYIWGKGERQIQAFEIHPENSTEPITKLPSYTAGTAQLGVSFFPKRMVDVRKVEIGKALRLNAKSIEEVSFSIPRNKPELFQDDVYGDTIDVEQYTTTAKEWLEGANAAPSLISLRPSDMKLLSEAPKTTTASTRKFIPASDVLSEAEKKRKEMDELFAKAKLDESSDEEVEKKGLDPPDDDW